MAKKLLFLVLLTIASFATQSKELPNLHKDVLFTESLSLYTHF